MLHRLQQVPGLSSLHPNFFRATPQLLPPNFESPYHYQEAHQTNCCTEHSGPGIRQSLPAQENRHIHRIETPLPLVPTVVEQLVHSKAQPSGRRHDQKCCCVVVGLVPSKAFLLGQEMEAVLESDQRCCRVAEELVPALVFATVLESAFVWDEVSALESVPIRTV